MTNITEATPENQHRTTSWRNSQNETVTFGHINSMSMFTSIQSICLLYFCLIYYMSSYTVACCILSVTSHQQLCCTRHDHNNKRDIYGHSKNVWKYLKVFVSKTENFSALYLSVQERLISRNEYLLNLVNCKSKMAKAEMRCEKGKQKLDQIYVKWPGEHSKTRHLK